MTDFDRVRPTHERTGNLAQRQADLRSTGRALRR